MTEKTKQYLDVHGVQVPYFVSGYTTVITDTGPELQEVVPPYVTALREFMENGSLYQRDNALTSITKEALLYIVRETALKVPTITYPLAVSANLDYDEVYFCKNSGRAIINEEKGVVSFWDADGDIASFPLDTKSWKQAIFKWPFTMGISILTRIKERPKEVFKPLTKTAYDKITSLTKIPRFGENVDFDTVFLAQHTPPDIGIITSGWDNSDLWESRKMPQYEKERYLFNSHINAQYGIPQRAVDIEKEGMQMISKRAQAGKTFSLKNQKALAHKNAWLLTSCKGIALMKPYQLDWFNKADLPKLVDDTLNLRVEFRDLYPTKTPEQYDIHCDSTLFERLVRFGLLDWEEIPSANPNFPPSVKIWLTYKGRPCALTDIKREGRDVGLTYVYVLYPVFDNAVIFDSEVDEDGQPVVVHDRAFDFVHPIEHLQKMLSSFDCAIRSFDEHDNERIWGYFPKSRDDWEDPKRRIKLKNLQAWLQNYCDTYGDPCPALLDEGYTELTPHSEAIASRTVVVDYGKESTPLEMLAIAKRVQKKYPVNLVGSKSKNMRVRKYLHANKYGGSCLEYSGTASLHRPGKARAQLLRVLKEMTMTIAIVKCNTQTQVYITPSGVQKQWVETAFLPKVFTTYNSACEYIENMKLDEEPVEVHCISWWGEHQLVWRVPSRKPLEVGKIIAEDGFKAMPLKINQVYVKEPGLKDTVPVDLLIPYTELEAKDLLRAYGAKAQQRMIYLPDGQKVSAMVLERVMYRSGTPSENVPPMKRISTFKGINRIPVKVALQELGIYEEPEYDISFAVELQQAKLALLKKFNIQA